MRKFAVCLLLAITTVLSAKEGTVVLVHGFLRTPRSLRPLAKALTQEGWTVVNWGYPSRAKTIEQHAADLAQALSELGDDGPIYFVTHSMGGLIVRAALNHPLCPEEAKVGRAVLLAPPNQGSAFARRIGKVGLVRWVLGPASGRQLLSSEPGDFDSLGTFPPEMEVLVIAGARDGKVATNETHLRTPHTHIVVPHGHTFIMRSTDVISLIYAHFSV